VVCASAGNHAQGVAWSCRLLDIPAVIFVPTSTPRQKLSRIIDMAGDNLHLRQVGDTFDQTQVIAIEYAAAHGLTFIPPFDHPAVIAGQGTVGLEILQQSGTAPPDAVVAPVGGGGLLAGIAVALAGTGIRLIGVEPAGAASMTAALAAGRPVSLESLDPFVDGAAVRQAGVLTHQILAGAGARIVTVDEGRVCTELLALYQHDGIIAEPAGALASAGLQEVAGDIAGMRVACVLSGGNNDISRYAEIAERSLVYEGLKHYFLVEFPQRPGALRSFLDDVLGATDDITFFEYAKKTNRDSGPAMVGIELTDPVDLEPLLARMRGAGLSFTQIDTTSPLFRFLL
jgi:threonine dehydratase